VASAHCGRVCEGDGEWAEPILGADGNAATIRFKIYATRPVAAPEEVEVIVEEEEEELHEVDINTLRDLCLCHRACDQVACHTFISQYTITGRRPPRVLHTSEYAVSTK
jgi:hypothetical protein